MAYGIKARLIVTAVAALIVGLIIGLTCGAFAASYWLGRFMADNSIKSSQVGVVTKVKILKSLREKQTEKGIQRLELLLDVDILGLTAALDEKPIEPAIVKTARFASEYRKDSGDASSSPLVNKVLEEIINEDMEGRTPTK